jgi:hypothetical protein
MAEANFTVGQRVAQEDVDTSKAADGHKPETFEVEGQISCPAMVVCPYCYTVNDIRVDHSVYLWFRCWNCGNYYQA